MPSINLTRSINELSLIHIFILPTLDGAYSIDSSMKDEHFTGIQCKGPVINCYYNQGVIQTEAQCKNLLVTYKNWVVRMPVVCDCSSCNLIFGV